VLNTAKEAIRRGYEVQVAASGHGELASQCHIASVPYRELLRLKRNLSPIADIAAVLELRSLMRDWKPDVVFLHSSKIGVVGSIAARLAGVKRVIYRIAGWSFLDPVSPLQKSIRRWSERLTAKLKDVIIVLHPNDHALAIASKITPRKQLVVVSNGVDLTKFESSFLSKTEARKRLEELWVKGIWKMENGKWKMENQTHLTDLPTPHSPSRLTRPLPNTAPLVLTIANFYPTKNLLGYLDTVAIVHAQNPEARFLVVGDGEERQALETKRKELGLDQVVSFPGITRDASVLLPGADLFALASLKEGMPWVILEAMAAGLPCIATDVGANKWMIGSVGWIAPPGNPSALASAIVSALADPDAAREKGDAAKREVAERFTAERMWKETFDLL
jgi:glycosyltransferase involved in cell wall biosynthesis